jgi:MFS family permease
MTGNRWIRIGGTLMMGLFVAYLDRINLSVALQSLSTELGFTGSRFAITSSWALTTFLIAYAASNFFGGIFTRRADPKWIVISMLAVWSTATLITGFVGSLFTLLVMRAILGIAEGIYWPQQSRFARAWFAPHELTRANTMIQYYGQYIALSIGFFILTPVYDAFGWRYLFYITAALGLFIVLPLFWVMLRKESEAPYMPKNHDSTSKLTLKAMGGRPIFFLIFSNLTQAMLFWGVTLWLPMVVKSLGYSGFKQGLGSALPYLIAILLAIPMSYISDKTGKRLQIATLGLIIPGSLMILLPFVDNGLIKLIMISLALGYGASNYSPNFWTILQSNVEPAAIGPAAGILNGIAGGGGGTIAGFIVGILLKHTGSYMPGFVVLGVLIILGGLSLILYGKFTRKVTE